MSEAEKQSDIASRTMTFCCATPPLLSSTIPIPLSASALLQLCSRSAERSAEGGQRASPVSDDAERVVVLVPMTRSLLAPYTSKNTSSAPTAPTRNHAGGPRSSSVGSSRAGCAGSGTAGGQQR